MNHYAHSHPTSRALEDWESLEDHLLEVAALAGGFAESFGARDWGYLSGLWHDLGKYSDAFQSYLRSSTTEGDAHQSDTGGRVDHSTAGAQHVLKQGALGRFLAYVIAGHHAGLPDNIAETSSLEKRLRKVLESYDSAPPDMLAQQLPSPVMLNRNGSGASPAFTTSFFIRMLFSCLVDADFLATEKFMNPAQASQRPSGTNLSVLLERLESQLDRLESSSDDTPVNRSRRQVLAACRSKAESPPGLFSLNVPTGGGKTLSSLAFALRHSVKNGLRRVVYAIPFTSIIEQTVAVFREAMGDREEHVLEHHSNLEPDDPARQSVTSRLSAENFDAPIVVTTNVQLFESLFANRTSRCRKLHRLARSVIILDEAQALPPRLLAPTLAALDELVRNYGSTLVLCTATQPAVEKREQFPIGLSEITAIIESPDQLHRALRRTRSELAGTLTNSELTDRLRGDRQVLCIVNTRRHAAELYDILEDDSALHLSASMCAAHRSDVVAEMKRRLPPVCNAPCRVISTQVIEAGVDVDFPIVYRAVSGLDSITQAAGRCNREGRLISESGESKLGRVVVFDYDEREHRPPPFVRVASGHFRQITPDHMDDLLAPAAVHAFFRLNYWQQGGDGDGWDQGREGQSVMECFGGADHDPLHHQFRQAAERYQFIDDTQTPIIVPYGQRGRALIDDLQRIPESALPGHLRAFDRAAQRYTVSVHDKMLSELVQQGLALERHQRHYLVGDNT